MPMYLPKVHEAIISINRLQQQAGINGGAVVTEVQEGYGDTEADATELKALQFKVNNIDKEIDHVKKVYSS